MALTVRLDPKMEARIAQVSKRRGVSKSEWVRQALKTQLASEAQPNAYELYLQVVEEVGLADTTEPEGPRDLSASHRRVFVEKLRAKHRR